MIDAAGSMLRFGDDAANAAKIATIPCHIAPPIYPRRGSLMRGSDPLPGCEDTLFGSAGFPVIGSGKFSQASVRNR
jgi:hypothetical protein